MSTWGQRLVHLIYNINVQSKHVSLFCLDVTLENNESVLLGVGIPSLLMFQPPASSDSKKSFAESSATACKLLGMVSVWVGVHDCCVPFPKQKSCSCGFLRMVKHQLPDHELTICWNVFFPQLPAFSTICVEATTVMQSTGTPIYSANLRPFFPSFFCQWLSWAVEISSCFHIKWNFLPHRETARMPAATSHLGTQLLGSPRSSWSSLFWRSCNVVPHLRDQTVNPNQISSKTPASSQMLLSAQSTWTSPQSTSPPWPSPQRWSQRQVSR